MLEPENGEIFGDVRDILSPKLGTPSRANFRSRSMKLRLFIQRTNRLAGIRVSPAYSRAAACCILPPILSRTELEDASYTTYPDRSSASSRRVAIRPAPVAESSSSHGIMALPCASQLPRAVPEESLDQRPISRCLWRSGRRNHLFGDESCAIPARPNHLSHLRFRRS